MKINKKSTIIVFVLLVVSSAIIAASPSPDAFPTAVSSIDSSATVTVPTIWSSNYDISATNGDLVDIACDENGQAHAIYLDATGNLYHVEHNGVTFSSPHLLGLGSGEAAICVVGTTIHIAWLTQDHKLQYTRRTGTTWAFNHTISGTGNARDPDITASSTQAIIFWREDDTTQLMLARGSGTTWNNEVMYSGTSNDDMAAIEYKDGRLHVAFTIGGTLHYRSYQGTTIEVTETICSGLYYNPSLSLAFSSTDVYLAYVPNGLTNCSYRSKPIGTMGSSWSAATNYTGGSTYQYRMWGRIAYAQGTLYFAWQSYKTSPWTTVCHFRTFNGTWSNLENASAINENYTSPHMALKFDGVVIGFSTYPGGVPKIRYKYLPLGVSTPLDIACIKATTGLQITWVAKGHVQTTGNFRILKNGALIFSGIWSNGDQLPTTVDGMVVGTFNYTIVANVSSGYEMSDTVIVTVSEPHVDTPDNAGLIAAIVIPCAIGGGLLVLFLLDKKKVINLKKVFGKMKRQPTA